MDMYSWQYRLTIGFGYIAFWLSFITYFAFIYPLQINFYKVPIIYFSGQVPSQYEPIFIYISIVGILSLCIGLLSIFQHFYYHFKLTSSHHSFFILIRIQKISGLINGIALISFIIHVIWLTLVSQIGTMFRQLFFTHGNLSLDVNMEQFLYIGLIFNIIGSLILISSSRPIGKHLDKIKYKMMEEVGLLLKSGENLIDIFEDVKIFNNNSKATKKPEPEPEISMVEYVKLAEKQLTDSLHTKKELNEK